MIASGRQGDQMSGVPAQRILGLVRPGRHWFGCAQYTRHPALLFHLPCFRKYGKLGAGLDKTPLAVYADH
jgi:hypothetical protein